ncbi:MAG: hypothetical protein GXP46_05390 [Deferribacteres bacterium]|nr:hypothetical protein [Deferribacteres bacterium]
MKKLLVLLFLPFLWLGTETTAAAGSTIYIAEPIYKAGTTDIDKTLVTLFKPTGAKIRELYINGIMPRVSPDGRYFAYMEADKKSWTARRAAIADSQGRKIRNLPFNGITGFFPNGTWSPDGNRLILLRVSPPASAVLSPEKNGREEIPADARERIEVVVIDFDSGKTRKVHHTYSRHEMEYFTYTATWFPDNKRILFAGGSRGAGIINSYTGEYETLSKDGVAAYLVDNGRKIFYLSGRPDLREPLLIWRFNPETRNSKKLFSVEEYAGHMLTPPVSPDGRYLLLIRYGQQPPSLMLFDIPNKRVTGTDFGGKAVIPLKFSPDNNRLVACMAEEFRHGPEVYGICDFKEGRFTALKTLDKRSQIHGEAALAFFIFMSVEWVE